MKRRGIGTSRLLVVLATAVSRLAARRRVLVLGVSQVLSHLHWRPAMAIAFFYAVGTGLGGIIGPVLFGKYIEQGRSQVAFGYYLGAGLMIAAGLVELVLGVEAAQRSLEDIATPLTSVEAAEDAAPTGSREDIPAASGFRWGPP